MEAPGIEYVVAGLSIHYCAVEGRLCPPGVQTNGDSSQKDASVKTDFEDAFEKYAPVLLQSKSIKEPGSFLDWCDYTSMKRFMYAKGTMPKYLVDRLPYLANEEGIDIQKIVRDDISFIDSKTSPGIQIADLLASGVRRLLRQGFSDNKSAATLLGQLMIQQAHNDSPISFLTFGTESSLPKAEATLVRRAIRSAKPLLRRKA